MGKRSLIGLTALIMGLVFVTGVLAQKISSPKLFSGTITKVDLANKEIVIQNKDGEMTLQWTDETKVNGSSVENGGLIPENLKEGRLATVLYGKEGRNWVASRIDVKLDNLRTLKGWKFPFECGTTVC